jgi:tetratricopeptide (TPR) repeat protein
MFNKDAPLLSEPSPSAQGLGESEREKFLLNRVIDTMSGNCLGLSTFYWSLAERLDLSLSAVIIPQHVFLRYYQDKNTYRNIEPTAYGAEVEDKEYIKQTKRLMGDKIVPYTTPDKVSFYVLSKKEFIGLILYNRGVDYLKREEIGPAHRDLSLALRLYPNFHEAYKSRAGIYLKQEQYASAVSDLNQAMALEPDCPSTYFNLGNGYYCLKDYNSAIKHLDKAIEVVPQYLEAYHHRGLCYALQERNHLALSDLSFVISASPSPKAFYDRGLIYLNMKKYYEAIADFNEAISRMSAEGGNLADGYNNRGICYANQERYPEAIRDFEKAVELEPQKSTYLKNLGVTYYKMKTYQKALEVLKKCLKLNPEDEEVDKLVKHLKQ